MSMVDDTGEREPSKYDGQKLSKWACMQENVELLRCYSRRSWFGAWAEVLYLHLVWGPSRRLKCRLFGHKLEAYEPPNLDACDGPYPNSECTRCGRVY